MAGFIERLGRLLGLSSDPPAPEPRPVRASAAAAPPYRHVPGVPQPRTGETQLARTFPVDVIADRRLRSLEGLMPGPGSYALRGLSQLTALPRGTQVRGSLRIANCPRLEALPEDLRVLGDLIITGCPRLTEIPATIEVGGKLKISGRTRLGALPRLPKVRGNLILDRAVTALPEGLTTPHSLVLVRCKPLVLPRGMVVGGDLVVRDCGIDALPDDLRVAGGVELRRSRITAVPAGVAIGTFLDLEGSAQLVELPEGLELPGGLVLAGAVRLRRLPRVTVGFGTPPLHGPERVPRWHPPASTGHLDLRGCTSLEELAEGTRIERGVEVSGTRLARLPESCARTLIRWRGVGVSAQVAFHPEALTEEHVLGAPNAEVRRVLLERMGLERFAALAERRGSLEVRDRDRDPGGERRLLALSWREGPAGGGTPMVCLECRCPPTQRVYLLRVPPRITTCAAAAAWIAGFDDPAEYRPLIET